MPPRPITPYPTTTILILFKLHTLLPSLPRCIPSVSSDLPLYSLSLSLSRSRISQGKKQGNMPQAPSTRWCPTPEQLMILEEMYRSGIRTPNATQIQQITAHLSYYGKIEGKNVFYWFQNHKARERQKLRRRLSRHQQLLQQSSCSQPLAPLFQMDLPPPPPPPPLPFPYLPRFLQQGMYQESNPALNLLCKMETCGMEGEMERSMSMSMNPAAGYGEEWMVAMDVGVGCCRPLKTLDLFPTKSTGLKEECSPSKSSSCSTSATN